MCAPPPWAATRSGPATPTGPLDRYRIHLLESGRDRAHLPQSQVRTGAATALWHRLRTRVEAHLFISVLAYHASASGSQPAQASTICASSWTTLRYELNRWHRIRTVLPKDRAQQAILLKQDQDLTPLRKQIALILGLQTHRFATKKMIDRDTKV